MRRRAARTIERRIRLFRNDATVRERERLVWIANGRQRTAGSGQMTAENGERAVDSRHRTRGSGQPIANRGQRTAESGQSTMNNGQWTVVALVLLVRWELLFV